MIQSFADKHTESFYSGEHVRAFQGFAAQAERRLNVLDAATTLADLANLPSNRLEVLSGNRAEQGSAVSESTSNGEFVLFGKMMVRMMWK